MSGNVQGQNYGQTEWKGSWEWERAREISFEMTGTYEGDGDGQ